MAKISKIILSAFLMQAGVAYAVQAPAAMPLAVRGVPVVSAGTDRLSETAAGLAAARRAGDDVRAEELLSRLYAGGGSKERATPVYAVAKGAVPVISSVTTNSAGVMQITVEISSAGVAGGTYVTTFSTGAAKTAAHAAPPALTDTAAQAAAAKKSDDAQRREHLESFVLYLGAFLLLLLL